jgi:hypothetical protein
MRLVGGEESVDVRSPSRLRKNPLAWMCGA